MTMGEVQARRREDQTVGGAPEIGFGVYVHWPFCKAKCPYCDFNSHVRHQGIDQQDFAAALVRELSAMAARTPGRQVTSVFFGGGTPSLMEPLVVETIMGALHDAWQVAPDVEVTLEANPTSVEARNFSAYHSAGVTRISIGVQSLNDAALKFLGRQHSAAEALDAIALARSVFDRVSFDLIYARPGHTVDEWRDELVRALELAPDHISAYQLTIEPDTAFFDLHAKGALKVPGDDRAADLFDVTQELCERAGLPAYEISNHARSGAESRHNLLYWRYGEYVGIGPGAHSRLAEDGYRTAVDTIRSPELWRAAVDKQGHGHLDERRLTPRECADEMLLMGLRLAEGVALDRLQSLGGFAPASKAIGELETLGLVHHDRANGHLTATACGRLVLNGVIAALSKAMPTSV